MNLGDDEEVADKRRDLERLAYGRADGPEGERLAIAASQALAQLMDERPAVAAASLLLGVNVGSIATSAQHPSVHPASAATSSPTTSPTPQDPVSDVSVANRWFAGAQAATDKYPYLLPDGKGFVSASTRLVADSTAFGKVWIAKKAGAASGCCLMTASPFLSDGISEGAMACVSMRDFLLHGISVAVPDDSASAHWAGGEVSITAAG